MRQWAGCCLAFALHSTSLAASPWVVQPSGTTERLRGVAAVDDRVAWASGNRGACLRTTDGGATWAGVAAADAAGLDFRDVEAFDDHRAFVLAIGPGEASRVFKSTRHAGGGITLVECYRNRDPKGFLDAIAFWDRDHGLALGDPVDGRFVILATDDGGRIWTQLSDPGTMPPALPGEGAFAASGTCLVVGPDDRAWFATGGAGKARVFRSTDRGRSWEVVPTTIDATRPSRGIFGLGFRDALAGIAVGGDYKDVGRDFDHFAATNLGGRDWAIFPPAFDGRTSPTGFRSAVSALPHQQRGTWLAVGPGGTDLGIDRDVQPSQIWRTIAGADGYHALAVAPSGRVAWAVGEGGKIGKLDVAEALKGR